MERDALQIAQESGDKVTMASANRNLGNVAVFRGDVASARKWLDTASALAKETGNPSKEDEIQYWRNMAEVTEGRFAPAEASVRALSSRFRQSNDVPNEIRSTALLVEVLLAAGKSGEAQKELASVQEVASKAQCFEELLQLRIADDQLKASTGKTAEARRDLAASEVLAAKKGFVWESLEAKLALGQIELTTGPAAAGKARLARLENEARAKGFGMIARRAAAFRD
jgi:ATP/maltotriose-dependent transcriptional regulator MalT